MALEIGINSLSESGLLNCETDMENVEIDRISTPMDMDLLRRTLDIVYEITTSGLSDMCETDAKRSMEIYNGLCFMHRRITNGADASMEIEFATGMCGLFGSIVTDARIENVFKLYDTVKCYEIALKYAGKSFFDNANNGNEIESELSANPNINNCVNICSNTDDCAIIENNVVNNASIGNVVNNTINGNFGENNLVNGNVSNVSQNCSTNSSNENCYSNLKSANSLSNNLLPGWSPVVRKRLNSGGSPGSRDNHVKKFACQTPRGEAIENSLELSNKFAPLNPEMTLENADNQNVLNNAATDANDSSNAPPKPKKPDPFFIQKCQARHWTAIIKDIELLIQEKPPLMDSGNFIKIYPKDTDQFRKIQSFLIQNSIKSYAMNPREERPLKVLIKGIPNDIPIDLVREELTNLGFNVHRVAQLRKFREKTPLPIFLCNLNKDDKTQSIYELNQFLGFYVKVESYRFKGVKQCYNCMLFNHSSENCRMDPRCLKCAGPHKTFECTKDRKEAACCANCGGEHPANFKGCPAHPQQIKNKKTEAKTIRDLGTIKNVSLPNNPPSQTVISGNSNGPKLSYAEKVKNCRPYLSSSQPAPHRTNVNTPANTGTRQPLPTPSSIESTIQPNSLENLKEILATLQQIKVVCDQINSSGLGNILSVLGNNQLNAATAALLQSNISH